MYESLIAYTSWVGDFGEPHTHSLQSREVWDYPQNLSFDFENDEAVFPHPSETGWNFEEYVNKHKLNVITKYGVELKRSRPVVQKEMRIGMIIARLMTKTMHLVGTMNCTFQVKTKKMMMTTIK